MGEIDRQRVQAVQKLQKLGLVWHADVRRRTTELEVLPEGRRHARAAGGASGRT